MTSRIHTTSSPRAPGSRSRVRRAIAAIAGLGALAAAAPAFAQSTFLNFFTVDGKGYPGVLIDDFSAHTGMSHGQREDENKPLLSATPLQETLVSFTSEVSTTEADIFTLDPSMHAFLMRNTVFLEVTGGDPFGNLWLDNTVRPVDGDKVNLPYAVLVPYPNQDVLFQPPGGPLLDAQVTLDVTKFVGGAPHSLVGIGAAPGSEGSVKGFRVYDHGWCSATAKLEPIYGDIQQKLWTEFSQTTNDAGGDAEQFYTAAVTILDRDFQAPTNELHDGFQFGGHLHAHTPWPAPDIDATGFMEAELSLQKGHLRADFKDKPVIVPDIAANPWVSDQDVIDLVNGMFEEVLKGVGDGADAQQTINPLAGKKSNVCDPTVADPCAEARGEFGSDVAAAAILTGAKFGVNMSSISLHDAVSNPDLWSCVLVHAAVPPPPDCNPDIDPQCVGEKPKDDPDAPPPDVNRFECRMFLPAKRLNVYPDEAELVWFDSLEESDNPAVGVFAAAYASGDQKAVDTLCNPRPDYSMVDFAQRQYAVSYSGYAYSPAP